MTLLENRFRRPLERAEPKMGYSSPFSNPFARNRPLNRANALRSAREAVGSLFDMMERRVEPEKPRDELFDRAERRRARTAQAIQEKSLIGLVEEENEEKMERIQRAKLLRVKLGIYIESRKQRKLKLQKMRIANLFTQSQAKTRLKNLLAKFHGIKDVSTHANWVESMIQNHRETTDLVRQGVQVRVENGRAITGEKEQKWIDWASHHRMELVNLIHQHQGNLEAAQRTYFKQFPAQVKNEPISLDAYRSQRNLRKAA